MNYSSVARLVLAALLTALVTISVAAFGRVLELPLVDPGSHLTALSAPTLDSPRCKFLSIYSDPRPLSRWLGGRC